MEGVTIFPFKGGLGSVAGGVTVSPLGVLHVEDW